MLNPDRIHYTPSLPALLHRNGISLLLTARHSNYLIVVRTQSATALDVHYIPTHDPFTVAWSGDMLAIGYEDRVAILQDAPEAHGKLRPPDQFDAVYVPRIVKLCGAVSGRDLAFGQNRRLYVASASYSSVLEINPLSMDSFAHCWHPPHITETLREDRCHLNGVCMVGGYPRLACMVDATSNERQGWRAHKGNGAIIDMVTDKTLVSDLAMPHSPRWHRGGVWFCDSARGLVRRCDPQTGRIETLGGPLPGFTRGLDFHGNLAFVAVSKVRDTAATDAYPHLGSLGDNQLQGVWVLPISREQSAGYLHLPTVGEISDLKILPHRYPAVIVPENFTRGYPFPQQGFADLSWKSVAI